MLSEYDKCSVLVRPTENATVPCLPPLSFCGGPGIYIYMIRIIRNKKFQYPGQIQMHQKYNHISYNCVFIYSCRFLLLKPGYCSYLGM